MPKAKRRKLRQKMQDLVAHPRYGNAVIRSGYNVSAEEIRASFYRYCGETIFPESAIPANIKRQNFSTFARGYYVDILKKCRTCRRPFLFFAKEQQYWHEVLGFYIDADCVDCPECRRSDQLLRRRFRRYAENIGKTDIDDDALATLVGDAAFLWQAGVLHNEHHFRRLRNLAHRRIPHSKATTEMDRVIADTKGRDVPV
jgi:hypothetical protein